MNKYPQEYNRLRNEAINGLRINPPVVLEDIPKKMKYISGLKLPKESIIHNGQRKLFLNELQFCTKYVGNEVAFVVYAGAAPNNKGALLAELFPNIKFLFIDPNPFNLNLDGYENYIPKIWVEKDTEYDLSIIENIIENIIESDIKINIINDLMTNDLARALSIYPCYFISDIRTNSNDNFPDAVDILFNSAQMFNWITVMKPIMSMLKFRHPFYSGSNEEFYEGIKPDYIMREFELSKEYGIDFIKNYQERKLEFLDGKIYIQPFAPISSTESRLVTDGKAIKDYGIQNDYEDKFFYYNNIMRYHNTFNNPNANIKLGFDHCADCALENLIWQEYISKCDKTLKVITLVNKLSIITHRSLATTQHGKK